MPCQRQASVKHCSTPGGNRFARVFGRVSSQPQKGMAYYDRLSSVPPAYYAPFIIPPGSEGRNPRKDAESKTTQKGRNLTQRRQDAKKKKEEMEWKDQPGREERRQLNPRIERMTRIRRSWDQRVILDQVLSLASPRLCVSSFAFSFCLFSLTEWLTIRGGACADRCCVSGDRFTLQLVERRLGQRFGEAPRTSAQSLRT